MCEDNMLKIDKNMLNIENMKKEHIEQICEIEKECFSIPWSYKSFLDEIKNKLAIYTVIIYKSEVVAYGGMWHVINEGHITNIAVKKRYRKQGIGDMLIKNMINIANKKEMIGITLEVRKTNDIAQIVYKKNGFNIDGIRKEYYDNREDAIIMWKNLNV